MPVIKSIRGTLIYTATVLTISLVYFVYVYTVYPPIPENETFLSEVGEVFGEAGLWGLMIIYARTLLKLVIGKGPIARRILPDYSPPISAPGMQQVLGWLDRTHIYVGIASIAVILIHIGLMGIPLQILFFPAVLALIIWQGLFGLFLSWRYSPKQLKKMAYLVHAQFLTGIMIGVFAFLGHLLIDD